MGAGHKVTFLVTKQLPMELYKDLLAGDVRGAYESVISIGKPAAIAQTMQLRAKLAKVASKQGKSGRPLLGWVQDVFQVMEDLHTLKDPVSEREVRQIFYAAFEDDPKYTDFIRDLTKNSEMSVIEMKNNLVSLATVKKDLVADPKAELKVARAALRKEKRNEKKNLARAATDSSGSTQTKQLAHPPPGRSAGKGKGRAEGATTTPDQRKEGKKELCKSFLFGSCKFGDTCFRSRMTSDQIEAEKKKRGQQRSKTVNERTSGDTSKSKDTKGGNGEKQDCY